MVSLPYTSCAWDENLKMNKKIKNKLAAARTDNKTTVQNWSNTYTLN